MTEPRRSAPASHFNEAGVAGWPLGSRALQY